MNILAIGAHFDDVELGCAGTLARHIAEGDNVYIYVVTLSGYSNQNKKIVRSNQVAKKEGLKAMKILGVKQLICGNFKTLNVEFDERLNKEINGITPKVADAFGVEVIMQSLGAH